MYVYVLLNDRDSDFRARRGGFYVKWRTGLNTLKQFARFELSENMETILFNAKNFAADQNTNLATLKCFSIAVHPRMGF